MRSPNVLLQKVIVQGWVIYTGLIVLTYGTVFVDIRKGQMLLFGRLIVVFLELRLNSR